MPGNRAGSQVEGLESKCEKSYFIHTIPSQLPVKNFWFQHFFQFCCCKSQRTFWKNLNPDFQVWLLFFVQDLLYSKKNVAEFDAELIGTNFKIQKEKIKSSHALF